MVSVVLFGFESPLGRRCNFIFSLPLSVLGSFLFGVRVLDTRCGVSACEANGEAFDCEADDCSAFVFVADGAAFVCEADGAAFVCEFDATCKRSCLKSSNCA